MYNRNVPNISTKTCFYSTNELWKDSVTDNQLSSSGLLRHPHCLGNQTSVEDSGAATEASLFILMNDFSTF